MGLNLVRWSHFASVGLSLASCVLPSPSAWMEEFWDQLQDRQISGLMLPGSHNSGNTKDLASRGKCQPVYDNFKGRIQDSAAGLRSMVTDPMLQQYFQPWNVNQHLGITEQLSSHGVRWLHLKVCNDLGENPITGPFNLSHVYHTHGGFTSMSLATILSEILSFLTTHSKEIAVVGLNDFFQMENRSGFSTAVAEFVASSRVGLVRAADWSKSVKELVTANRRLAVFIPNATHEGTLPSAEFLTENYDDALFQSEDFDALQRWLEHDARTHAGTEGKFYAFSAHPTKNPGSISVSSVFTQSSEPMLELQRRWFQVFPAFLEQLLEDNRSLVLNGVSTDFVHESQVFALLMRLQGFCHALTSSTTTATATTSMTSSPTLYRITSLADQAQLWLPLICLASLW